MTKVVFACVHNAGRSQMAAAWFNHLRKLGNPKSNIQNPKAETPKDTESAESSRVGDGLTESVAVSAGTSPAARVHPAVVEVMREAGIDLSSARPQKLTADLVADA
jgi:protein-tyrosine-phosphatase